MLIGSSVLHKPITWNVADTDKAPINTQSVTIYFALDGQNFNKTIAENIPNTGSYTFYSY